MPAYVQLEHLQGGPPPVAVPVVAVRFRDDDSSGVDTSSPILPPADVRAQLVSGVTGADTNTTTFDVTPITTRVFTFNDYAILDAGTPRQEVIRVIDIAASVTNSAWSTITATVQFSHAQGSVLAKCVASFGKTFQFHILSAPTNSISNVRFFRNAPLPYGVYDQYRLGSIYTASSDTPWFSDVGPLIYPMVPTSYPVLLQANPVTTIGPLSILVGIQWIYVARLLSTAESLDASSSGGSASGSAVPCQPGGLSAAVTPPSISQQLSTQLQVQPSNYHWRWDES
jgi:hypothetical protein